MLAELQGRLPIRVELKGLEAGDLKRILTEPKANLIEQQKQMIQADHVTLHFTPEAIEKIAEIAASINKHIENIGARRLYTVLEKIMETISFEAPDMTPGSVVTVDEKLVTDKLMPLTRKDDIRKFIL
jgi:ATP-dependent HslUV protease ATP-binding subunit HslU